MSQFEVEEESLCNEPLDSKKRKLLENVEDSDEKDTKKAKVEEEKEEIDVENESQMERLMGNPNMWHIHNNIFGHLNHDTVEICRQVCKSWNESLKRTSLVKFLQEFGDKNIGLAVTSDVCDGEIFEYPEEIVSDIIPGWPNAVKKYGGQASIEDLQEVKVSLRKLLNEYDGTCWPYPVHEAASEGAVKLMKLILNTSYDFNTTDKFGHTALHFACNDGRTEVVQLLISSSKKSSINLNARINYFDSTALHLACENDRGETVQLMMRQWKEFGIDIKARDNEGKTPLDITKERTIRIFGKKEKSKKDEGNDGNDGK